MKKKKGSWPQISQMNMNIKSIRSKSSWENIINLSNFFSFSLCFPFRLFKRAPIINPTWKSNSCDTHIFGFSMLYLHASSAYTICMYDMHASYFQISIQTARRSPPKRIYASYSPYFWIERWRKCRFRIHNWVRKLTYI